MPNERMLMTIQRHFRHDLNSPPWGFFLGNAFLTMLLAS